MNIRQLEIFSAVCEDMSMSKAAARLYISQSAVSQTVRDLEKEYRTRLFERLSRRLYLTESGRRLLFYAGQILYSENQLNACMAGQAQTAMLRLGVATTVGSCLLHPLLDSFEKTLSKEKAAPENRTAENKISVEIANSRRLADRLMTADLDMAILQKIPLSEELETFFLFEDTLVFVCPFSHPLAGKTCSFEELSQEPFILREPGSGTRTLLEQSFADRGCFIRASWTCPDIATAKDAAAHGRGITLLSSLSVKEEIKKKKLGVITPAEGSPHRQFLLAFHKDKFFSPAMKSFLDFCPDFIAKQAQLHRL